MGNGPNTGGVGFSYTPIESRCALAFKKRRETKKDERGRTELVSWRGREREGKGWVKDFLVRLDERERGAERAERETSAARGSGDVNHRSFHAVFGFLVSMRNIRRFSRNSDREM